MIKYTVVVREVPFDNGPRGLEFEKLNFEKAKQFKYPCTVITDSNNIRIYLISKARSGNPWYFSIRKLLTFTLLPRDTKLGVYRTMILLVVL